MPFTDSHPSALISWAHTDDAWTSEQEAARHDDVLRLSAALRQAGIDADLDLHHLSESVDWTRWGPGKVAVSDYVLVVVSSRWRSAWEGRGDPTKGAGAAAETDALRSLYSRDREQFLRKVRIVQLPGSTSADIPDGLHGVPRFQIDRVDAGGLQELLRSLTSQAEFPKAPLGPLPVLPPAPPAQKSPTAERDRLMSTLDALPVPTAKDEPDVPWYRERQRAESRLRDLDRQRGLGGSPPLRYGNLSQPLQVRWRSEFAPSNSTQATLALHVSPVPARPLPARQLAAVAAELPRRVRGPGLLDATPALDVTDDADGVTVALVPAYGYSGDVRLGALQGARIAVTGQVSAWTTLPADGMGTLIDQDSLTAAISECLRLVDAVGVPESDLAIAVEIGPVLMVNLGSASGLGRSGATMNVGGPEHLRVDPDEVVDASALAANRAEAAATLAALTLRNWRRHWPR